MNRFSDVGFHEAYLTTVGIDYKKKQVEYNGDKYTMCLWDTAGQERFHTITFAYFRGCHGMLLVYDITNRESFERVSYWMKKIKDQNKKESAAFFPQMVLVGNKADLETSPNGNQRVVTQEEGKKKADEYGMGFIEASAKDDHNVEEAFMMVLKKIVDSGIVEKITVSGAKTLRGEETTSRKRRPCC